MLCLSFHIATVCLITHVQQEMDHELQPAPSLPNALSAAGHLGALPQNHVTGTVKENQCHNTALPCLALGKTWAGSPGLAPLKVNERSLHENRAKQGFGDGASC